MLANEQKAIARHFYERGWNNGGDPSVVDELFAETFLNHEVVGPTTETHCELYKQAILETFQMFPDWSTTIDDVIAEGEKVVLQWHARGIRSDAGGEQLIELNGITIVRIIAGKITEFWKKDNSFEVWHTLQ